MGKLLRRAADGTGFTLIEVMMAMAMLAIALLGICAAQLASISSASRSRYLSDAMYLAQEQTEFFASTPLANLPVPSGTPYQDPGNPLTPSSAGTNLVTFNRSWSVTGPVNGITTLQVTVVWVDNSGINQSVGLETWRAM